jgi:hypothetical protein
MTVYTHNGTAWIRSEVGYVNAINKSYPGSPFVEWTMGLWEDDAQTIFSDTSGNNYHITPAGNFTIVEGTERGRCIQITDDSFSFEHTFPFFFFQEPAFFITGWFRSDALNDKTLFVLNESATGEWGCALKTRDDGSLQFSVWGTENYYTPADFIQVFEWFFIGMYYDVEQDKCSLFLNNTEVITVTDFSSKVPTMNYDTFILGDKAADKRFHGMFSDIRLYNTTKDANQRAAITRHIGTHHFLKEQYVNTDGTNWVRVSNQINHPYAHGRMTHEWTFEGLNTDADWAYDTAGNYNLDKHKPIQLQLLEGAESYDGTNTKIGNCILFPSSAPNARLEANNVFNIDLANESLSVSFWFYDYDDENKIYINFLDDSFVIKKQDNYLEFSMLSSSDTLYSISSANPVYFREWYHVVAIWDHFKSELSLDIDNQLQGSLDSYSSIFKLINSIHISGQNNNFNGYIDQVRLFDFPLNYNDKLALWNNGNGI